MSEADVRLVADDSKPTMLPSDEALAGPRAKAALGGLLLTASPVIALVSYSSAGGLLCAAECGDGVEPDVRARARRLALGLGAASSFVGGGLLALGILQIKQIRRARAHVALLERASLDLTPGGAQGSLSFPF